MTDTIHSTRLAEPFPFSNREFAAETLPTVRAASLFAGADQATVEDWLRDLTATPEGLAAIFDLLQRFTEIATMLDVTRDRIDATLVAIGRVRSA